MGIASSKFSNILREVFAEDNTIRLCTDATNESMAKNTVISAIPAYTIKSSDFSVSGSTARSNNNMLLGLYEGESDIIVGGFCVYEGGTLVYFGTLKDTNGQPMVVGYNTVPTIKKYNSAKKEGIYVELNSEEIDATPTA